MNPWKFLYQMLSPKGESARLSVLMYHGIHETKDVLLPESPDRLDFERQMAFIRRNFNVLALREAIDRLTSRTLPDRALCVTFDDGYANNYDVALPVLEKFEIPAAVFIATDYLDGGIMFNDVVLETVRSSVGQTLDLTELGLGMFDVSDLLHRRFTINALIGKIKYLPNNERMRIARDIQANAGIELPCDYMMTRVQVKSMAARGMTIGAHTMSHPILSKMDELSVERELRGSKTELEKITTAPVEFFAYPNGVPSQDYHFSHTTIVRNCGFLAAFTTAAGSANAVSDLMQIPRYTPWERDTLRYGIRLAQNLFRTAATAL